MKNIFETDCTAIVVTVNCEGVMGAGIAKQCAKLYPRESMEYRNLCKQGYMTPGHVFAVPGYDTPKWIIFFATKDSWRKDSQLEWIQRGMKQLVEWIPDWGIDSIAIPPLGCGNGNLKWETVKPIIEKAIKPLENVRVEIYEPGK